MLIIEPLTAQVSPAIMTIPSAAHHLGATSNGGMRPRVPAVVRAGAPSYMESANVDNRFHKLKHL